MTKNPLVLPHERDEFYRVLSLYILSFFTVTVGKFLELGLLTAIGGWTWAVVWAWIGFGIINGSLKEGDKEYAVLTAIPIACQMLMGIGISTMIIWG